MELSLIKVLLENDLIKKENNRELYNNIINKRREITKYFKENYNWNLYSDRNIIRLEKIPSTPEIYMGNTFFTTKEEYCIFVALLITLEKYSIKEKFIFIDAFNSLKINLEDTMDISWEKRIYRKAVKKVFEFAEEKGLIINKEHILITGEENNIDDIKILYEKTELCSYKYLLNNFNDIFSFNSYEDFEKKQEDTNAKQSLNRKLISKPVIYLSDLTEEERREIPNRRSLNKFVENIEGKIQVHKNGVFLFFNEGQIGEFYPNSNKSENIILLNINNILREKIRNKEIYLDEDNDTFTLERKDLKSIIENFIEENKEWLPNKLKEKTSENLLEDIIKKMKEWLFLEEKENKLIFLPAIGKITGYFEKEEEDTEEIEKLNKTLF